MYLCCECSTHANVEIQILCKYKTNVNVIIQYVCKNINTIRM